MNFLQAFWAAVQCKPIPARRRNWRASIYRPRNITGLIRTATGNRSVTGSEGDATGTGAAVSTSISSDHRISLCKVESTKVNTSGETHCGLCLESDPVELDVTPESSLPGDSLLPSFTPITSENLVTAPYCSSFNGPGIVLPLLLESIIVKGASVDRGKVDCDKSDQSGQHMSIALGEKTCSAVNNEDEEIGIPLKDED